MKDTDGKMKYIPKESHKFTSASVLNEHTSRLVEPVQDMDGATPPVEIPVSVLSQCCSHDEYENEISRSLVLQMRPWSILISAPKWWFSIIVFIPSRNSPVKFT